MPSHGCPMLTCSSLFLLMILDCAHCRFHGSKTRSSKTIKNQGGYLLKQEMMEMLWTLYPPREAKVEALRRSTWARPVVEEFEIDPQNIATPRPESSSNGAMNNNNDNYYSSRSSSSGSLCRSVFLVLLGPSISWSVSTSTRRLSFTKVSPSLLL